MRFDYPKFARDPTEAFPGKKWISRPVLSVTLIKNGKEITTQALIDSGSDYNIFNAEIGDVLGLNIKEGKKLYFWGTSEKKQLAYYHNIIIKIGGWEYECYCGFSYDIGHLPYGLLGQNDFFKKFKVIFDYSKERFEIKENNNYSTILSIKKAPQLPIGLTKHQANNQQLITCLN